MRLCFQALSRNGGEAQAALDMLAKTWRDGYAGMIVDLARLLPAAPARTRGPAAGGSGIAPDDERSGLDTGPPSRVGEVEGATSVRPVDPRRQRLIRFLEKQTGQRLGDDLRAWRRWIWRRPYEPHPDLVFFKSALYASIDPKMGSFFNPGTTAKIRLDEVDFGIVVNSEARAYPKRILAWHELALDRLGGEELAVVYCTLCGSVIPYGAEPAGRRYTFGTSGLLYRSNKLMFDHETRTLWSTLEGRPVIGPLADSSLELPAHPVVTTTWEEWVRTHPGTTVLAQDTGFDRDYAEGAAYREYFATDALMFDVPTTDERLKNKAEVLTLLLRPAGSGTEAPRRPFAISAQFLKRNPVHHLSFAGHELVVVTSAAGANRVFAAAPRERASLGCGPTASWRMPRAEAGVSPKTSSSS